MKENFTSINIVLDRSGSMKSVLSDTIGGFNSFLSDQQKVEGEAVLTLATFANDYKTVYDFADIKTVKELTEKEYVPSGWTALLDALGNTINSVGEKLAAMKEEDRPSKVIFVIMTDGKENKSVKFNKDQILSMINHQEEKYNWTFVFIGADKGGIEDAASVGVASFNSLNLSDNGMGVNSMRRAYSCVSEKMTKYRATSPVASAKIDGKIDFFEGENKKNV